MDEAISFILNWKNVRLVSVFEVLFDKFGNQIR